MITTLLGTRAQLIKMAPLILEMERRGYPQQLLLTGQHKETMRQLLADFGVRTTPVLLYDGPEVSGIGQVIPWFAGCFMKLWRQRHKFFPSEASNLCPVVLVHGDTFSTLLGALIGRLTGQTVAHVESGLRSFNIWHPFPEEITRLLVFRLSDLAYCPDEWALSNLRKYSIRAEETGGNTLLDALRIALSARRPLPCAAPDTPFGVVSLHRFENIFKRQRLLGILEMLESAAKCYRLVFVLHPATRRNLEKHRLFDRLAANGRIALWPRMGYFEFVSLLERARFVITDGGSNQEELFYLDKPTLLMRQATERQEGLGENAVLCGYDQSVLDRFLDNLDRSDPRPWQALFPDVSPCSVVADSLWSYVSSSGRQTTASK